MGKNLGTKSKRFIIFVIDHTAASATSSEMATIDAFNDRLREEGHWLFAGGLAAPSQSMLIDNRDHAGVVSNRSLFAGHEHYSGFWIVDADSVSQAEAFARDGSATCNRKVELRPFL